MEEVKIGSEKFKAERISDFEVPDGRHISLCNENEKYSIEIIIRKLKDIH